MTKYTQQTGTLYGVSLGPGDPELITRRAWALLQRDNTYWTYPVRHKKHDSYALGIVQASALTRPEGRHQSLVFPMTHDAEKLTKHWFAAANTVQALLQQGTDVLFLVEGDASTYSTFGHLARTVRALDASIRIETVPGVTSFHAAAAQLQTPLTEVDDTLAILPAGYGIEMIGRLLNDFDTLVLLKVKPLLDDILTLLNQQGLLRYTTFIEKAGSREERIIRDASSLRGQKVNYLSLLLIKNPQRPRGEVIRGCRKKSITNARLEITEP